MRLHGLFSIAIGLCSMASAWADLPKVAVTDLTYEERVKEYFSYVSAHEKTSFKAKSSERERETDHGYSAGSRNSVDAKTERSYTAASGVYSYIEWGELRKFTADVKGEMLKSGSYRLTQGKPYTQKNSEKIYDIIDRIKKGYYPGANYVLFGTVSNIEFRDELQPVIGSNATSAILSLDLVADFSLINTKTYEIKAAFSAMGTGQDIKLLSGPGQRVVLNRGKVMHEVSKSLGVEVARQLEEQFRPGGRPALDKATVIEKTTEQVIIYR
ncbi:MAG: penicillin-binding protein activator LpoB [Betaproteobacteria bacterium]|nr:penicillin-binding protein activator LpoB [Betaproteobacteria bacterium]